MRGFIVLVFGVVAAGAPAQGPVESHWLHSGVAVIAVGGGAEPVVVINAGGSGHAALTDWLTVGADVSFDFGKRTLEDRSTHLSLRARPPGWHQSEEVTISLFPADSRALRVAAEPLLAWGGALREDDYQLQPAVALAVSRGAVWAEAALKSSTFQLRSLLAPYLRGGWSGPFGLVVTAELAHVPHGVLTTSGESLSSSGGALRLSWSSGAQHGTIRVLGRDFRVVELFDAASRIAPPEQDPGLFLEAEVTAARQRLPSNAYDTRLVENTAWGGKLLAVAGFAGARLQTLLLARDPDLRGISRWEPGPDLPSWIPVSPELYGELAADYPVLTHDGWLARVGVLAALHRPIHVRVPQEQHGDAGPPVTGFSHTPMRVAAPQWTPSAWVMVEVARGTRFTARLNATWGGVGAMIVGGL